MKNDYKIIGDKTIVYTDYKEEIIEFIIDTKDLKLVDSIKNKWSVYKCSKSTKRFYIQTCLKIEGKWRSVFLHRFITDSPSGYYVDHINRNTLDNTRSNLRLVTPKQNSQNLSTGSNSKTNIRGVAYDNTRNKFKVQITVDGKYIFGGRFNNIKEAERAAVELRKKYMPFSFEEDTK